MPLLEILTRCYGRPTMLRQNKASLDSQTSSDWMQTFLHDRVGRGVAWANRRLALYGPHVEGRYIWVLDDDDICTTETFVEEVGEIVETYEPDVVMVKCAVSGHGIVPEPGFWKREPRFAHVAMSGFVVRNEVFRDHAQAFAVDRGADHSFIRRLFDHTGNVYWHDRVVMRTLRVSGGRPE